jgi:hypothetical protein
MARLAHGGGAPAWGADALDAALDRALASVPAATGAAAWRALSAESAAARAEHARDRTLTP